MIKISQDTSTLVNFAEPKSKTMVSNSASCIVWHGLQQLNFSKRKLATFWCKTSNKVGGLSDFTFLVDFSTCLFHSWKEHKGEWEKVTGKLKISEVFSKVITCSLMPNFLPQGRLTWSKFCWSNGHSLEAIQGWSALISFACNNHFQFLQFDQQKFIV